MKNYVLNICRWVGGWAYFDHVKFFKGWSNNWQWKLLYGLDHALCVIVFAGAVEPVSGFAQRHRTGQAWDALLDLIEAFDPGHGVHAGTPLWGSVESPKWVRITVPVLWALFLVWVVFA